MNLQPQEDKELQALQHLHTFIEYATGQGLVKNFNALDALRGAHKTLVDYILKTKKPEP